MLLSMWYRLSVNSQCISEGKEKGEEENSFLTGASLDSESWQKAKIV